MPVNLCPFLRGLWVSSLHLTHTHSYYSSADQPVQVVTLHAVVGNFALRLKAVSWRRSILNQQTGPISWSSQANLLVFPEQQKNKTNSWAQISANNLCSAEQGLPLRKESRMLDDLGPQWFSSKASAT